MLTSAAISRVLLTPFWRPCLRPGLCQTLGGLPVVVTPIYLVPPPRPPCVLLWFLVSSGSWCICQVEIFEQGREDSAPSLPGIRLLRTSTPHQFAMKVTFRIPPLPYPFYISLPLFFIDFISVGWRRLGVALKLVILRTFFCHVWGCSITKTKGQSYTFHVFLIWDIHPSKSSLTCWSCTRSSVLTICIVQSLGNNHTFSWGLVLLAFLPQGCDVVLTKMKYVMLL